MADPSVPLDERALYFSHHVFHQLTYTRTAAMCRDDARKARAAIRYSDHPLLCLARAAWWEALADRITADSAATVALSQAGPA